MGGRGSGRRRAQNRKRLVEDCEVLNLNGLRKQGLLSEACSHTFLVGDLNRYMLEKRWPAFSVRLNVVGENEPTFSLKVTRSEWNGERREDQECDTIPLVSFPAHFGAVRWYMQCPGLPQKLCGRQCSKLYLPPGEQYFRCRDCHALTYRCVRQRRSRARAQNDVLTKLLSTVEMLGNSTGLNGVSDSFPVDSLLAQSLKEGEARGEGDEELKQRRWVAGAARRMFEDSHDYKHVHEPHKSTQHERPPTASQPPEALVELLKGMVSEMLGNENVEEKLNDLRTKYYAMVNGEPIEERPSRGCGVVSVDDPPRSEEAPPADEPTIESLFASGDWMKVLAQR